MIARLKSMFVLLGGNIREITDESELEKLQQPQVNPDEIASHTRKKGRPKKVGRRSHSHHSLKQLDKLDTVRIQMNQCLMACEHVKRREKLKGKLIKSASETF